MSTDGIELPQGYVERPFDYSGDLYIEGQLRPIIEANRALVSERDALLGALRQIAEWPDGGSRYGQEKIKRFAQAVIDAALAAQQPAAPSEDVNVAGMPEFDGLLDHIYEYGTASEGVIEKANAFARAVIARYAPQQPAAVDEAMVERACRHWYVQWDEADQATKMLWAKTMFDLLNATLEAARETAERWRALREIRVDCDEVHPEEVDAAIDRAREGEQ